MAFKYETHMHTSEGSGCGRNTGAEQARAYKKRGYQGIIVTDHFINGYSKCPRNQPLSWEEKMMYVVAGYKAAKAEGDQIGLDVFLGWEFTIKGSDFLTYGLDWDFLMANPDLHLLEIKEYSALVRKSGGFLAQAHPYRVADHIAYQLPVDPVYIDAVEVHNQSDVHYFSTPGKESSNSKALQFAQENNLPMQAGTDSHSTDHKMASGISLSHRAGSIFDIISAIKNREAELIIP